MRNLPPSTATRPKAHVTITLSLNTSKERFIDVCAMMIDGEGETLLVEATPDQITLFGPDKTTTGPWTFSTEKLQSMLNMQMLAVSLAAMMRRLEEVTNLHVIVAELEAVARDITCLHLDLTVDGSLVRDWLGNEIPNPDRPQITKLAVVQ